MSLHGVTGLSDRFLMVDPLRYFSFQPVINDWYNKGRGMYYPVYVMVYIKDPLHFIGRNSPCSGVASTGSSLVISVILNHKSDNIYP